MVDQPSLFDPPPPERHLHAVPAARTTDPDISHHAADTAEREFASRHRAIALEQLLAAGRHGVTDHEMENLTGIRHDSIGVRRGQLMKPEYGALVSTSWRQTDDGWKVEKRQVPWNERSTSTVWVANAHLTADEVALFARLDRDAIAARAAKRRAS